MFKKYKHNGEIEFAPVYFNSETKRVINHRFKLENSIQEILYMIDIWINEESDWIVESIEFPYINISTYRHSAESSYISLPVELKSPRKGLINIKNKDQKCFLWCCVRHSNPSKNIQNELGKLIKKLVKHITNPEEITEEEKEFISNLDNDGIEFPVQKKYFRKTEVKKIICINVFGHEDELVFPIYVSDQKF